MVFKPGEIANPEGGRARKPFVDAINMEVAMRNEGRLDPVPKASIRAMIRTLWQKALDGDLASLTYLTERVEGKARVQVTGDDQFPIAVTVSRGDDAAARIASHLARIGGRI